MEFYKEYFLINLKDYSNIGIDLEIVKLLLILALAAVVAIIAINYIRYTRRIIVKRLMRREAVSEESALTLDELDLNRARYRRALDPYKKLSDIVGRVGEKEYTYDEYVELLKDENFSDEIDFNTARFYIRPTENERAMKINDSSDALVLHTVMECAFIIAMFACLIFLMPSILNTINSLLG